MTILEQDRSLHIRGLKKHFDDVIALDGINLKLEPGHIVGLLGQNGAGKSTLIRLLSGVMRPTSGKATIMGYDLQDDLNDVKRITGLLPEEYALYEKLTVWEYIEFLGVLYDLTPQYVRRRFKELSILLRVDQLRDRLIETLSKGNKQKIALVAAVIHDPQVLFLDEALNNLDISSQRTVKSMIKSYKEESRIIVLATHLLVNVEQICDYVVIIDQGKIKYQSSLTQFKSNHQDIEEAYLALI